MLPKFDVVEHDKRFYVETNWYVDQEMPSDGPPSPWSITELRTYLQVTTAGRLGTSSAGWATKDKARAAMEQCKARLR